MTELVPFYMMHGKSIKIFRIIEENIKISKRIYLNFLLKY